MRDISLSNKDDLKITPPETLKRETLAVMESFGNSKEIDAQVKHRSVKRTTIRQGRQASSLPCLCTRP